MRRRNRSAAGACASLFLAFALLIILGVPSASRAQQPSNSPSYTVGILPFPDLSGNTDLGQLASVLPSMLQNSLLNHSTLVPRQIQPPPSAAPASPQQITDVPTAAQLGQANGTNLVAVGTLLSGEVETKQGTFNLGSFHGFGIGGNSNSQSSRVVIQVTLVDAARGVSLGTFRATGKNTETHIDPNATSNYGNMNMQSAGFQSTSLAKATRSALDNLTRQIAAALKKFTPAAAASAPAATAAAAPAPQQQVQVAPPAAPKVLVYGDKDLFGSQYPKGAHPTAGAQLYGLQPGQVSTATQTYDYGNIFTPGFGDLGGQTDYPGTDQLYVASSSTPQMSQIQRGPEVISMDYSSQVPPGQVATGLTLGMAASNFNAQGTQQTYTAWINNQIDVPLSRQLNSLEMSAQDTQFFAIGIDPQLLLPDDTLTLKIDASGSSNPLAWAIDFLTIGVTTAPAPTPPSGTQPGGASSPGAPSGDAQYASQQPGNSGTPATPGTINGQTAASPAAGAGTQGAPAAAAQTSPATACSISVPAGTTIEIQYLQGAGPQLNPCEQVAFLFVYTIYDLEHQYCLGHLNRVCSLDELISGVSILGSTYGLSVNPHQDTNYAYSFVVSGNNYQIAAVPQRPGLGGFLCKGGTGFMANFPGDFYYNSQGTATTASRELGTVGFSGNGFLRE